MGGIDAAALDNASAIRVCQPGPVAFQRANVSGGNRRKIDVRTLPDFGRPRGFNILAADAVPKISGNTSRALRARMLNWLSHNEHCQTPLHFAILGTNSNCIGVKHDRVLLPLRCGEIRDPDCAGRSHRMQLLHLSTLWCFVGLLLSRPRTHHRE